MTTVFLPSGTGFRVWLEMRASCAQPPHNALNCTMGSALNEDLSPDSGLQPWILLTSNFFAVTVTAVIQRQSYDYMQKWLSANMNTSTYKSVTHSPADIAIKAACWMPQACVLGQRMPDTGQMLPTKPHGDPQSQIIDNVPSISIKILKYAWLLKHIQE